MRSAWGSRLPTKIRSAWKTGCSGWPPPRIKNGRFPDAVKTFDQAIAFREKRYGAGHLETGNLLAEVGRICRARGLHVQAQAYLKRALRIHEAQCGTDSLEALADVQHLAGSLEDTGDLDGAAAQYERALGLKLRKLGCENIDEVAEMQYSLACLHIGWSHFARARELLMECIGAFKRRAGPRLAVAYESLAHVEEREGRTSFALDELERATKVWEKCDPPQLDELARNLELRADLSDHLRLRVEANHLRKRARHIAATAEDQRLDARLLRSLLKGFYLISGLAGVAGSWPQLLRITRV